MGNELSGGSSQSYNISSPSDKSSSNSNNFPREVKTKPGLTGLLNEKPQEIRVCERPLDGPVGSLHGMEVGRYTVQNEATFISTPQGNGIAEKISSGVNPGNKTIVKLAGDGPPPNMTCGPSMSVASNVNTGDLVEGEVEMTH